MDIYVWRFVEGKPRVNYPDNLSEIPTQTKESDTLSKDLKKRGMSFVGSKIIYAYRASLRNLRPDAKDFNLKGLN